MLLVHGLCILALANADWADKVKHVLGQDGPPAPWKSVAPDGRKVEVTPTKVNGVWKNVEPTANVATASQAEDDEDLVWSECHEKRYAVEGVPICGPINGSNLINGESYAIIWNPLAFKGSETVDIILRYAGNQTKGRIIKDSGPIPNGHGVFTLKIEDEWLKGEWNQSAWIVISPSKTLADHPAPFRGPLVFLQRDEWGEPLPDPEEEKRKQERLRLAFGIPASLFGVIALLWIWFLLINRRTLRLSGLRLGRKRKKRPRRRDRNVRYEEVDQEDKTDDDLEMSTVQRHHKDKRAD